MKKILYLALPLLLLGACKNEDENLFDAPPAERINKAIADYDKILNSSENGWLLEYFPDKDKKYGIYNAILKFKNGNVDVLFEGTPNVVTSMYSLTVNSGIEISFDTYNQTFMELFATPFQGAYNSLGGDVQYTIMSYENDVFTLQGKNSRNVVKMKRFNQGNGADYIQKLSVMEQAYCKICSPLKIGDKEIKVSFRYNNIIFDDGVEQKTIPFMLNENGFKLKEPYKVGDVTITEFLLNEKGDGFKTPDGYTFFKVPSPIDIQQNKYILKAGSADNSPLVNRIFTDIDEMLKKEYSWIKFDKDVILGDGGEGVIGVTYNMQNGSRGTNLILTYGLFLGGVYGAPDLVQVVRTSGANQLMNILKVDDFPKLLLSASPFKIEEGAAPNTKKLTSVSNPEVYFTITAQ